MKHYFVVSAVGRDRPGFLNRISRVIKELDGNIELERSTRMAAEFAVVMLVSVPEGEAVAQKMVDALAALSNDECSVHVREAVAEGAESPPGARTAELVASGADQPGIIDAVTMKLFQDEVNIESMDYDTESAPMTGEQLFRMKATLSIPAGVDVEQLRDKLRALEDEYNFDVILRTT